MWKMLFGDLRKTGKTMTIKLHTLDLFVDNKKHLYFVADVDQATAGNEIDLAETIYQETGNLLETSHLTTHEFPNIQALVNFLNGKTLHFYEQQIININEKLGLEIWQ